MRAGIVAFTTANDDAGQTVRQSGFYLQAMPLAINRKAGRFVANRVEMAHFESYALKRLIHAFRVMRKKSLAAGG